MRHWTPAELKQALETGAPPLVLDVREPWEIELAALSPAVCIPMTQLPRRLDEVPTDATVVVLCHHGNRSLQVADFLERNGFSDVINLTGGIDAWSQDVDPGVPTY
ncbi:MAG: rhodanese-like domain-containing protein [Gammaproteobacteria bacterium]